MKFDLSNQLAGTPLSELRKLFKKNEHLTETTIVEHLAIDKSVARKLIETLQADGFIIRDEDQKEWYQTTSLGKSLAASAVQRISNQKAKILYQEFLKRIEFINSPYSEFAYRVDRVILYGSYVNPDLESYGDIDLHVRLKPRSEKGSKLQKELEDKRRMQGQYPCTIFDRLYWPQKEVLKFLKNRSRYLSIQDDYSIHESIEPKGELRVIYSQDDFSN